MNHYFTNNDNLKSERKTISYNSGSSSYVFTSDNGVFSKAKIDFGSRLLIETYLKNKPNITNFLDVGCGYGFISVVLSKELNIPGTGIDINKRALKLAVENNKLNKTKVEFIESDIYEKVTDTYDLIITNPPIRAGKNIILKILNEAKEHLKEDGELWFVIRKDQGANSIVKELEKNYQIQVLTKKKGFGIFMAKRN